VARPHEHRPLAHASPARHALLPEQHACPRSPHATHRPNEHVAPEVHAGPLAQHAASTAPHAVHTSAVHCKPALHSVAAPVQHRSPTAPQ
jgi:hypothetical protein